MAQITKFKGKNGTIRVTYELYDNTNTETGYYLKDGINPLSFDDENTTFDTDNLSDVTYNFGDTPYEYYKTYMPNEDDIDEITQINLDHENCHVFGNYEATLPGCDIVDGSNKIAYKLDCFKGCHKIVYHDFFDYRNVRYRYATFGEHGEEQEQEHCLYKKYNDVFGVDTNLTTWEIVEQSGQPVQPRQEIDNDNPGPISPSMCLVKVNNDDTDNTHNNEDRINSVLTTHLLPIANPTIRVRLYEFTQSQSNTGVEYILRDSNGNEYHFGGQSNPYVHSNLPLGDYTLRIPDNINFPFNSFNTYFNIYGWDNRESGNDYPLSSNLLMTDNGERCGREVSFRLLNNTDFTVYYNKSYTVRIYSGIGEPDYKTTDNRSVDMLVENPYDPISQTLLYNDWPVFEMISSAEYNEALRDFQKTGYVFDGLRDITNSTDENPIEYDLLQIQTLIVRKTTDFAMLWRPININKGVKSYGYNVDDKRVELSDNIGTADMTTSDTNTTITITTKLQQGTYPEVYDKSVYYQLEDNYRYNYQNIDNIPKIDDDEYFLPLLSKYDIVLCGSNPITFNYKDSEGVNREVTLNGVEFDGTNFNDITWPREIYRPTYITNKFIGWSIDENGTVDTWFDTYTTFDVANQQYNLVLYLNNEFYEHIGNNDTTIYAVYEKKKGLRTYTLKYNEYNENHSIDFVDDASGVPVCNISNNEVVNELLNKGFVSSVRSNWTLSYDSNNDGHVKPIDKIGLFTDGRSSYNSEKLKITCDRFSNSSSDNLLYNEIANEFKFTQFSQNER